MRYSTTETPEGNGYRVLLTDNEGNFYTLGEFNDHQTAYDVERLLDMVESVWSYKSGGLNNRYVVEYCTDKALPFEEMQRYAKEHFDFLDENYHTEYAGTDSEGLWYNTTKHN